MKKKISFEEFEEKSNEIHHRKYKYHKDTYTNTINKTTITCPIHGDFKQTPKLHMKGQGCPECGKEYARTHRKYDYHSFLKKAYEKFHDGFSFPHIEHEYVNNKTNITIKCNKCGEEYHKRPNDLLGDRFNECANCRQIEDLERHRKELIEREERKLRKFNMVKEIYLKRLREKFSDDITPFMDEYVNGQEKIHFKCNKCGYVFKRGANQCLKTNGCPKCNSQMMTIDEFRERADIIHNSKYDYSESEYLGSDIKLKVICHEKDKFGDEHGEFWVTPHSHIGVMKSGCPKCSGKFRKDTEYFKKEAIAIHGDKYIYTNTKYVNALKDVEIICPTHGAFYMSPNEHLSGNGCPRCRQSHLENEMMYFLQSKEVEFETQKKFDWLGKQSLDFYLPQYNVAIECQGIQHFSKKHWWANKGEVLFETTQARDERKRKLCEENGVKLLYYSNLGIEYPYDVFEDKEELLQEILNVKKP